MAKRRLHPLQQKRIITTPNVLLANVNKVKAATVLITGGAGFIGSHATKLLQQQGFHTVVIDNLSRGSKNTLIGADFVLGDSGDANLLRSLFDQYTIDAVMHFASFIDVGESCTNPQLYYHNNVSKTLNLLNVMIEKNVKRFIFSSSAAVYGIPKTDLIDEQHICDPINPYGRSKWMVENILRDFDLAYGLKYCSLRYFNAAGGDPEGKIKFHQPKMTNLIPLVFDKLHKNEPVMIYGNDYETPDGTCIRDYIHIDDLSSAHLLSLKLLLNGSPSQTLNLGTGNGFSVKEVIDEISSVMQCKVSVQVDKRRQGDPARLIARADKAMNVLGWRPRFVQLREMIEHAKLARSQTLQAHHNN